MGNSDTSTTKTDLELGNIAVVHEVDIDTESIRTDNHDDAMFFDDSHSDSKDPLQSSSRQQGIKGGPEPKRQSSSGRLPIWRK
jgi:hypothetical protein